MMKIIASLLIFLFSANAFATAIAVPNFSFETPDITTDMSIRLDGEENTSVTGWISLGTNIQDPGPRHSDSTDMHFAGTTENINPLPGKGDGDQMMYLGPNIPSDEDAENWLTSADSLVTIELGVTYKLTVAVGDGLAFTLPDEWEIRFLAGTEIAATGTGTLTNGTFVDISTSFIANELQAGQALRVQLYARKYENVSGFFRGVFFDNVRVEAVPEPSSILLLMGCLPFLLKRRRTV